MLRLPSKGTQYGKDTILIPHSSEKEESEEPSVWARASQPTSRPGPARLCC